MIINNWVYRHMSLSTWFLLHSDETIIIIPYYFDCSAKSHNMCDCRIAYSSCISLYCDWVKVWSQLNMDNGTEWLWEPVYKEFTILFIVAVFCVCVFSVFVVLARVFVVNRSPFILPFSVQYCSLVNHFASSLQFFFCIQRG